MSVETTRRGFLETVSTGVLVGAAGCTFDADDAGDDGTTVIIEDRTGPDVENASPGPDEDELDALEEAAAITVVADTDGDVSTAGSIQVRGGIDVDGDLLAGGDVEAESDVEIDGDVTAAGEVVLGDDVEVDGSVEAGAAVTTGADVEVDGDVLAGGNVSLGEGASVDGHVVGSTVDVAPGADVEGEIEEMD